MNYSFVVGVLRFLTEIIEIYNGMKVRDALNTSSYNIYNYLKIPLYP